MRATILGCEEHPEESKPGNEVTVTGDGHLGEDGQILLQKAVFELRPEQ